MEARYEISTFTKQFFLWDVLFALTFVGKSWRMAFWAQKVWASMRGGVSGISSGIFKCKFYSPQNQTWYFSIFCQEYHPGSSNANYTHLKTTLDIYDLCVNICDVFPVYFMPVYNSWNNSTVMQYLKSTYLTLSLNRTIQTLFILNF